MTQKAPGRFYRKGITLIELFQLFPDDSTAEQWFIETRWPYGIRCPHCDSDNVQERSAHKTPHRCRDCRKRFSVKTGALMHGSNIGYQKWAIAIYLMSTNLKGVSSMKLHRDLGITQKSAWYMTHRIREAWEDSPDAFDGAVEVDESYFGGKRKNMRAWKREQLKGRGTVGKTAVVGMKERGSKKVTAQVIEATDRKTLQGFVTDNTTDDTIVYTDEARAYLGIPRKHETVQHSVGEYVREQAHTNGMESFWSMLKRGYTGTFHHISPKHLSRYIGEFQGRHNDRPLDTEAQMANVVRGAEGKRLRYQDLIR
ncbi:MAG: IS1595 family transposase [Chloroflexi bacterium]|nr:IS1595 family transposase [Chloroflexota bacterium]